MLTLPDRYAMLCIHGPIPSMVIFTPRCYVARYKGLMFLSVGMWHGLPDRYMNIAALSRYFKGIALQEAV